MMIMDSLVLQADTIVVASVAAVLLGFLLLVLRPCWRVRHGQRLSIVALLLMAGGAAVAWAAGQVGLGWGIALVMLLWALGWLLRCSRSTDVFQSFGRTLGRNAVQATALIVLGIVLLLGSAAQYGKRVPDWSEADQEEALYPAKT